MAPITQASDESNHQELLDKLEIYNILKPFRNQLYTKKKNKNIRQIISEASRKEASVLVTQNNSGLTTPLPEASEAATGEATPLAASLQPPNMAQATRNLNAYVLEKNAQNGSAAGPGVTYTNIESAPSLHPSSQRHYCDITGLPAPYTDPKTRLRYHNGEIFGVIRSLGQGSTEGYLSARGAQTVLK